MLKIGTRVYLKKKPGEFTATGTIVGIQSQFFPICYDVLWDNQNNTNGNALYDESSLIAKTEPGNDILKDLCSK